MNQTELINSHISLAETLAKHKKKFVKGVYYEDLESAALHGLVEAATKYDEHYDQNSFRKFACKRINGAMNDYLRELRWGSKRHSITVKPLNDNIYIKNSGADITDAIDKLPKEAQQLFVWHFEDGLNFRQIGEKLGVSKSSVHCKMEKYKSKVRNLICD